MKIHYYIQDILEICDGAHLTADDIHFHLKEKFPKVGISSVYRNIECLVEKGQLRKIMGVTKKTYYEKMHQEHIHLIDEDSGKILDYVLPDLKGLSLPNNFSVSSCDILIFGKFE